LLFKQYKWMNQDLSSVNRSRTPWVIFFGWVTLHTHVTKIPWLQTYSTDRPYRLKKVATWAFPYCTMHLCFSWLWNMCRSDTRHEITSYINDNCRHRPMYSSHIGIPVNVDLSFVTCVEQLLLKYQVWNHTSILKVTCRNGIRICWLY
jgi:hypothetical protein